MTGKKTQEKKNGAAKDGRKRSPHAYRQCAYCGERDQYALYKWLDKRMKSVCLNCHLAWKEKRCCGICGQIAPLEDHHIAGRLASDDFAYAVPGVSEITAALCINCHTILTRGFRHDQRRRLRWRPPVRLYVALHIVGVLELWYLWALRKGYLHGFPDFESREETG